MLHVTQTHTIKSYKNKHKGERCIIVGNGPSLNKMDLSTVKGEWIIGTNYSFLKPELANSRYICISDTFRMTELVLYIDSMKDKTIFYNSHVHPKTQVWSIPSELQDQTVVMQRMHDRIDISWDVEEGVYVNLKMASVVFPAIQLAAYMGAKSIYLIGVDQDYSGKDLWFHGKAGKPHAEIGGYGSLSTIGHNFRYDYESHFKSAIVYFYEALASRGISLYNATVGGRLNDIPRVDFVDVFGV